jgi:hypothetical protein
MTSKQDIRIVVYREDEVFVAQCLEYDICTQAPDKGTLRERMDCLIEIELREMEKTGQELDPAPDRFHDMWDEGGPNYKEVAA